jgi:hypothetical protein
MEAEYLGQDAGAFLVAAGDVDPDEAGVTIEERRPILRTPVVNPLRGQQANVHRLSPLGASSPLWPGGCRHDRDAAFTDVTSTIGAMQIHDVVTAPRSPWQNAYVERVIGSIRRE